MTRSSSTSDAREDNRRRLARIVVFAALVAIGASWAVSGVHATDHAALTAIITADTSPGPVVRSLANPGTEAARTTATSRANASDAPAGPAEAGSALTRLLGLGEGIETGASGGDEFLDPEIAFVLSAAAVGPDAIEAHWDIAEGYYIYRDRIQFRARDGSGAALGEAGFPKGKVKDDEYFGPMEVYYDSVVARVPVVGAAAAPIDVDITYQGCAEAGLCYLPITKTVSLLLPAALAGTGGGATNRSDAGSAADALGQSNLLSLGANAGASDAYVPPRLGDGEGGADRAGIAGLGMDWRRTARAAGAGSGLGACTRENAGHRPALPSLLPADAGLHGRTGHGRV